MESLNIGIAINQLLKEPLKSVVGNRIFPIVSELETEFPFVVYKRSGLNPITVKWGNIYDEITIEITVLSNNYQQSIQIAQIIRNTLDNKNIDDYIITLNNSYESYDDSYNQTLIFTINNNK